MPAVEKVIPDPAVRPVLEKGEDMGVFAFEALEYGDENARRLLVGAANYVGVLKIFSGVAP